MEELQSFVWFGALCLRNPSKLHSSVPFSVHCSPMRCQGQSDPHNKALHVKVNRAQNSLSQTCEC